MKKIFGLLVLSFVFFGMMFFIADAEAFEVETEPSDSVNYGIYLAPKFVYSFYTGDYITNSRFSGQTQSGTASAGGGLALGYDFYRFYDIPVRIELEYLMRGDANFDVNGRTMKAAAPKTLFSNLYLDYQTNSRFVPYLTGGAGVSFIDTQTSFAWNLGTGIRYALSENMDLDLSAKYINYGRYDLYDYTTNLNAIETAFGVSYTF